MSYRVTKPIHTDRQTGILLDELKYAINDLDRRMIAKENEKPAAVTEQYVNTTVIQQGGGTGVSANSVKQYRMKCRINTELNSTLDGYLIKNIHLPSNAHYFIRNALNNNPYMTYIQCPIYVDVTNIPNMNGEIIYTGMNLLLSPQMAISESEDLDSTEHFDVGMYFSASFFFDTEEYPVIFTMYVSTYSHNGSEDTDAVLIVKSIDVEQRLFLLDDNYQVYFDLPEAVIE